MTQTWMGQSTCLLLDLLLDELLAGLTSIASETLHAGLSALKATGTTSVIAEQPLPIIASLADHVSVLVNEATRSIESMTELPANTIST
jgi:ABC-type branched-subunit amino acid transport system ATPase component